MSAIAVGMAVPVHQSSGCDAKAVSAEVCGQLQALWPDYRIDIVLDSDFSD